MGETERKGKRDRERGSEKDKELREGTREEERARGSEKCED